MCYYIIMPINKRKNKYILILLCFIIPYLALLFSWNFVLEFRQKWMKASLISKVKDEYSQIKHEGHSLTYLNKKLNLFYGNLAEDPLTKENIEYAISNLREEGLEFLKFRFFDANKKAIVLPNEEQEMRTILNNIFAALSEPELNNNYGFSQRSRTYLNAFLGSINPIDLMGEKSNLIEVTIRGEKGYFYWNTFYAPDKENSFLGGVFVWCLAKEATEDFALKNILEDYKVQNPNEQKSWGVINFEDPASSYPLAGQITDSKLFGVFKEMRANNKITHELKRHVLFLYPLTKSRGLFCVVKQPKDIVKTNSFILMLILATVLVFQIKTILFSTSEYFFAFKLSKEILLLAFLLFFGVGFLLTSKFALWELGEKELQESIDAVDLGYNQALDELETTCGKLVASYTLENKVKNKNLLESYYNKKSFENFCVFSKSGKLVYSYPSSKELNLMIQLLQPVVKKLYMDKNFKEDSIVKQLQSSFYGKVSEELFASVDGVTEMMHSLERIDNLNEFWLTNKKYYIYSSFVENKDYKEPFLVMFWLKAEEFAKDYLENYISNFSRKQQFENHINLLTLDLINEGFPYPMEYSKYGFPREFKRKVVETGVRQKTQIDLGFEKYYMLATPLRSMPHKLMIAMLPLNELAYEHTKVLWLFIFGFISLFIGVFITKKTLM